MISGRYITELTLIIITAVMVGLTVLFNDINIQIRIKELRLFLQRSNREDNSIDHIGLVMKYRLHKAMYENRISNEDTSIIETRISSILSGREEESRVLPGRYRYMSVPVLFSINVIRYVIGMPLIRDLEEDELNLNLEVAYYYERNKDYKKAITLYNRILLEPVSGRPLKASVLLHQGFCYSIIGEFDKAKSKYLTVIKDYGDINTAVTAAVMLRYLEGFRTEIEKVLKTEKDSSAKGEKLYKLIAYTESYEVLKRIENTSTALEKDKIKFYKGRTLEELGEAGKAVEIYQQIIMDDPKSDYAATANRRIYLVGSVNLEGEKIRKLAVENNKLINDSTLVKMTEEDSKFRKKENEQAGAAEGAAVKDPFSEKIGRIDVNSAIQSGSIDRMIKKVEEKVNQKKNVSEKAPVRKDVRVKIFTMDGNIFTGILVKETPEEITISSSLGNIKISKSKISRRINL
jgi:tetratricopeptide (TPR) repeat protein